MFVGHYGPAYAAKATSKRLPLWLLFFAVQFLDIMWSILVLLGVEKLRIVHGFTASSALDLYYMPYTHGVIGALFLSAVLGCISEMFFRQKGKTFLIVALCVFSHWVLDLIVHVPDLPLIGNTMKVGFGLWQHRTIALILEFATLFAGIWIYVLRVRSQSKSGNIWLWSVSAAMVIIQLCTVFGIDPTSSKMEAISALTAYLLFIFLAGVIDRMRTEQSGPKKAEMPLPTATAPPHGATGMQRTNN